VSSPPLQPAMPPDPAWREIGRPSPGQALDWVTWVAPLVDREIALYRVLVVADGSISVAVEMQPHRGSGHRTIYRGRCGVAQDPEPATERVHALLRAADEAVSKALQEDRSGERAAVVHGRPLSPSAEVLQGKGQDTTPTMAHEPEHRLRERAYFLWEREGRPEGRAQEFWERAHREEARAA
jgi:hypothetical protein